MSRLRALWQRQRREPTPEAGYWRVRGYHQCAGREGTYDMRATLDGIVYCGQCGATDLLPTHLGTAAVTVVELDRAAGNWRAKLLRELREEAAWRIRRQP